MKCNVPFDAMAEIMNNPAIANQINNIPVVSIPANLPSQFYPSIVQSIIPQLQVSTQSTISMPVLLGCIESTNLAYHINTNLSILAWRNFDMSIGLNLTTSSNGWNRI